MTIRAKFNCTSQRKYIAYSGKTLFEYAFTAVSGQSEDDKKFWEASPSGELKISSVVVDQFEVGKQYYLDFNLANE